MVAILVPLTCPSLIWRHFREDLLIEMPHAQKMKCHSFGTHMPCLYAEFDCLVMSGGCAFIYCIVVGGRRLFSNWSKKPVHAPARRPGG